MSTSDPVHEEVQATETNRTGLTRRLVLAGAAGIVAGAAGLSRAAEAFAADSAATEKDLEKISNGRLNQSVVQWCFSKLPVAELAAGAKQIGLKSVELVSPSAWPMLKSLGLTCAISSSHGFTKGFAHKEEHAECLAKLREVIDVTSAAGFPSVITFSGMRRGLSDEEAMENMVAGLKQIVGHAEKQRVTVNLEVLNSRVNIEMKGHPDYFCDRVEPAIEIIRRVGSPRLKLLFDIYHVQIMQGDVISRIRQFHEYIGHYHTAGVPGRNELDDQQELSYAPIMRAIAATNYQGYIGQEFIPRGPLSPLAGLAQAAKLCDV
jgi:hydroxypyruvate isomerase